MQKTMVWFALFLSPGNELFPLPGKQVIFLHQKPDKSCAYARGYFRQKPGVNRIRTVKISNRPASIRKLRTHLATGCRYA